jgi:hypothetical protein
MRDTQPLVRRTNSHCRTPETVFWLQGLPRSWIARFYATAVAIGLFAAASMLCPHYALA